MAPVAYCPRVSVTRVSVRTHVDSTMPVTAVGDAGVMLLLHVLMLHRLLYGLPVFVDEVLTESPTVSVNLKISGVVVVGAYMITPIARGRGFPAFFLPSLWYCAPPLSALAVHGRWDNYGGCNYADPVGDSSSSCPYISSSSLPIQLLLTVRRLEMFADHVSLLFAG